MARGGANGDRDESQRKFRGALLDIAMGDALGNGQGDSPQFKQFLLRFLHLPSGEPTALESADLRRTSMPGAQSEFTG